jgi:3'(2'), 5'-bisphosphate nucleotidase
MKWALTRLVLSTTLTSKQRVGAFLIPQKHVSHRGIRGFGSYEPTLYAFRGGASLPRITIPTSFNKDRQNDVNTAILAVLAACRVTRWLQPSTDSSIATVEKQDASPVTIGDFASQATVLKILHNQFPSDMFIAEEGSDVLRNDHDLLNKVWDAVISASLGTESICAWEGKHEVLNNLDYGQGIGTSSDIVESKRRVWCLDPIDGTKGFLRGRIEGGQYCIALALLEDGVPVVSILGCPNQPVAPTQSKYDSVYGTWSKDEIAEAENQQNDGSAMKHLFTMNRGCLFVAVRGCGCYEVSIHDLEQMLFGSESRGSPTWRRLHVTSEKNSSKTPSQATFCLGVERGFSDPKGTVLKIAELIHGEDALVRQDDVVDIKNSFRLDGQGKYGLLARGEAEYFLRLPKPGYVDWVWDVAAGYLCLQEAGGKMTDVKGTEIDFSGIGVDRCAKLPDSVQGLLGSCGGTFHDALVDAYASVES